MKAIFALIFTLLFSVCAVFPQNAKIDSLKKVIATTKVDTVKGRSLCRLCGTFRVIGKLDEAIEAGLEGQKIGEKEKDLKGISFCLSNMGVVYDIQGDYHKALVYFEKSLKIKEQLGDKKGIALALNNIANNYKNQGDNLPKALEAYQKSLKIREQIGDKAGIPSSLGNIGLIYDVQKDFPKALEYYFKSLEIAEQLKSDSDIAGAYNNIGLAYFNQGNLPKAFEYYQKCLDLMMKIEEPDGITHSLHNIGGIYFTQGNYLKALEYIQKSVSVNEQIGNKAEISHSLAEMGLCYLNLKDLMKAKEFASKGYRLAQEVNHLEFKQSTIEVLYQVDSALGDYKSAFEHHKLYKQYSDSLHNEEKSKEMGRVESKYQFEKEAEEAKRKEAELTKIEAEKTERRNNLQYLTIFAGLIGLFAGLVFMGKFKIPTRVIDIAVFAGLLILFEFLLILFDPLFEQYSGGIPFYKLGFNTVVAFAFAPLHGFLEGKLKRRLVKSEL